MVILEGVDCVGKTTVAMALRRLLPGWSYRHHGVPPVAPYKYFGWFLADTHPRVIVDRMHWSEEAYGKTYRNGSQLSPSEWRNLELLALSRNAQILLLEDDPTVIADRWDSKQEFSVSKLKQLIEEYDNIQSFGSVLPCIHYNMRELVEDGTPTLALKHIAQTLRDEADHAAKFLPASVGCGSLTPTFLVLGEEPRDQMKVGGDNPQVPLGAGPSCDWLWRALDELDVPWYDGYYTNCSAFTDPHSLASYIRLLGVKRILCLGNKALKMIEYAKEYGALWDNVRANHVYHPAYVKRFLHDEYSEWRDSIGQALSITQK
jgi:hypothetical protein